MTCVILVEEGGAVEPNYKELAEDLRYQFNKFIELWKKVEAAGLSVSVIDNKTYFVSYSPHNFQMDISRTEKY